MKKLMACKLLFLLVFPFIGKAQKRRKDARQGAASYYADRFHGKATASGELFNMEGYTAAHRSLPFGTLVRVHNLADGRSVIVRINDRGPHCKSRLIDLSKAAARQLGMIGGGSQRVRLEVIKEWPHGWQAHPETQADFVSSNSAPGPKTGNIGMAGSGLPPAVIAAARLHAGFSYRSSGSVAHPAGYAMQVASYHDHESALFDARSLEQSGMADVYVQVPKMPSRLGQVYRVMVGAFKSRELALATRPTLSKRGYEGLPASHL